MKNLKRLRQRRSQVAAAIMISMLMTQGLYSKENITVSAQEKATTHSKSTVNYNQKRNVELDLLP